MHVCGRVRISEYVFSKPTSDSHIRGAPGLWDTHPCGMGEFTDKDPAGDTHPCGIYECVWHRIPHGATDVPQTNEIIVVYSATGVSPGAALKGTTFNT